MGANQSAGRPSNGPRSIPVRPRTPLRFGSVPTPLPVDPAEYNTRPIRNLYPSIAPADSVTSLLSQENYLCPPPLSPTITEEEEDTPSPASWSAPTRFHCPHSNCAYSVIGFHAPEELDMHLQSEAHFVPHQQAMMNYPQPMQQMPQQPAFMMETEQQCMCPSCNIYQDQWSPVHPPHHMDYSYHQHHHHFQHQHHQHQHQQMHMMHPMLQMQRQMTPMIVGYNGPEVENLNWSGERIPKAMPMSSSYPVLKRQRLEFPLNP